MRRHEKCGVKMEKTQFWNPLATTDRYMAFCAYVGWGDEMMMDNDRIPRVVKFSRIALCRFLLFLSSIFESSFYRTVRSFQRHQRPTLEHWNILALFHRAAIVTHLSSTHLSFLLYLIQSTTNTLNNNF